MFEKIGNFFNKMIKPEVKELTSKDAAKERLHLVLMQDRANVSVDFLELMKQEIIDVIKKYIEVDENAIDVRLTNQENEDGTNGAPSLYANIPILNIKNDAKAEKIKDGTLVYENNNVETEMQQSDNIDSYQNDVQEEDSENQNEEVQKDEENTVIELGSNVEEVTENVAEPVNVENEENTTAEKDVIIEENTDLENSEEVIEENKDEEVQNFSEESELDDEDEEDVTFDDLLKKAEEEEELIKNQEGSEEKNNNEDETIEKEDDEKEDN
ncbi:MAG: cell division topological specificity factor MinE [Clostridia bacterium]